MHRIFITLLAAVGLIACNSHPDSAVANPEDYEQYLASQELPTDSKYFRLWNGKIKKDSIQTLSLVAVAGEYDRFFKSTGDISYLKKAEQSLRKAVEHGAINKAGFLRALARNYISQHRFREADSLGMEARAIGSGVRETHALLFDTAMELGKYGQAVKYLDSLKNTEDFGYLVRLAKYNDYQGDLDTAIRVLEKASKKAEAANNNALRLWSYTNLADYYGHAGRIDESYQLFLKALDLDPGNAYAKKGIAWIVYAHDDNPVEALRILDSVTQTNRSPDYFLLMSEIAQYAKRKDIRAAAEDRYAKNVANPNYGDMYNLAHVERWLEDNPQKALALAQREYENRSTPETAAFLAKAHYRLGNLQAAMDIVDQDVYGKSSEPAVLLEAATIYKAAGNSEITREIKKELAGARFELGPVTYKEVAKL